MLSDPVVSLAKIVTLALWAWVLLLTIASWVVWALDREGPWLLIATTACASSAVAATATIRGYAAKMCALIRAKSGEQSVARLH